MVTPLNSGYHGFFCYPMGKRTNIYPPLTELTMLTLLTQWVITQMVTPLNSGYHGYFDYLMGYHQMVIPQISAYHAYYYG